MLEGVYLLMIVGFIFEVFMLNHTQKQKLLIAHVGRHIKAMEYYASF